MNILSRSTVIAVLAISQFTLAQEVNKQTANTTNVVVEQPTTTVEATPLVESQAERMRKQRQEIEVQTEQKIVEKLENSRLEDERKRADALFGNKADVNVQKVEVVAPVYAPQQTPVQQVVPVQPQQVVPVQQPQVVAPVVVEQKVTPEDLSSAKKEIIEAINEKEKIAVEAKALSILPIERRLKYYVESSLGSAEYGSAVNISGRGAFGVTLGYEIDDNMQIEGNFVYSNYYMDDYYWVTVTPVFKELAQYNLGSTLKYAFLSGRFRPYVGGSVDFTYRRYFDRLVYTWNGAYIPQDKEATSYAMDIGFVTGADFVVTDQFSVGLSFSYTTNIMYRTQSEIIDHQYRSAGANLVEETDYTMFLLNGKFRF